MFHDIVQALLGLGLKCDENHRLEREQLRRTP
jgi:hypothetical protein